MYRRSVAMLMRPVNWLAGVLVVCVLGVTVWWFYDLGKVHGVAELAALRAEKRALKQVRKDLEEELESLRTRAAVLERSSQIDQQAAQAVKSDLGRLEDELQAAREEVEFYRGIVAPGDVNPGLRIHRFLLDPGTAADEFHYELVLTQLKHNDRAVSGMVNWKIAGKRAGQAEELDLAAVAGEGVSGLKFRFRYFQELTGTVRLPAGFAADQVVLTVTPDGGKQPIVQQFEWPASVK